MRNTGLKALHYNVFSIPPLPRHPLVKADVKVMYLTDYSYSIHKGHWMNDRVFGYFVRILKQFSSHSPPLYHWGQVSIQGSSIWDFWWTNWPWCWFPSENI